MSPKDPDPIFLTKRYLAPTMNSLLEETAAEAMILALLTTGFKEDEGWVSSLVSFVFFSSLMNLMEEDDSSLLFVLSGMLFLLLLLLLLLRSFSRMIPAWDDDALRFRIVFEGPSSSSSRIRLRLLLEEDQ